MPQAVLLVDDDDNLLRGLARALREQPYRLYTARSGDDALHILRSRSIQVLVTDEQMPGMSGGDLVAWTAEHCPEVVRIMLTGNASTEAAIRAINEGRVFHFFTKPCDTVQLGLSIRRALEHYELIEENRRLLNKCQPTPQWAECIRDKLQLLSEIISVQLRQPLETAINAETSTSTGPVNAALKPTAASLDHALHVTKVIEQLVNSLQK